MVYSPENNPYIPGDPYSYDLKWLVRRIKNFDSVLSDIDSKIQKAVIDAYTEHGEPVIYSNAQDLIVSDQDAKSLAFIQGYYTPGDEGDMIYYITDDSSEIAGLDFYLTLNTSKWAIPVFTKNYVTPEMFGAVGDGSTDDTDAWQKAVDNGRNVKAAHKKYWCDKITITKNIEIDGNNADFYCPGDHLFYCQGEVIDTIPGQNSYTAYETDYTIADASYSNYTGYAMLKGTNNFEKSRDYYTGGFVCEFSEGKMTASYPLDVTGVSIEIIKPITISFERIGNITHGVVGNTTYSISIYYGLGCVIKNSNMVVKSAYGVILFSNCLNCVVDNCRISQVFGTSGSNSYLVLLGNSSFCSILNCYMYNKYWHCITTGDTYACYHNRVDNCNLYSDENFAVSDHENGVNTIITNSTCSCIDVAGLGVVDNCVITSLKSTQKHCQVRLSVVSDEFRALYDVSNIKLITEPGGNGDYIGVILGGSSRSDPSATFYVKECNIRNVWQDFKTEAWMRLNLGTTLSMVIKHINIDNCNLNIEGGIPSTATNYDISEFVLTVNNLNTRSSSSTYIYPALGLANRKFNKVVLNNVMLRAMAGIYESLIFSNLYVSQTMSAPVINTELIGTGLRSRFTEAMLLRPAYLNITDMRSGNVTKYNICSAGADKYWTECVGGTMTTTQIV